MSFPFATSFYVYKTTILSCFLSEHKCRMNLSYQNTQCYSIKTIEIKPPNEETKLSITILIL